MFETDKYEPDLHVDRSLAPKTAYEPAADVSAMSLLIWGEHCIECAAPDCFSSCDLYQKRPDQRCRRFTYGISKNHRFPSLRGYGVEIAFKKWGKLETRGNTALTPRASLLRAERALEWLALPIDAAGKFISAVTRDIRWSYANLLLRERLGRWLHRRSRPDARPDAFLLEVYNPSAEPINLQLVMTVARKELGTTSATVVFPSFRTTFALPGGYSRHTVPRESFASVTESGLPFDIALIPEGETNPVLVFITADFVTFSTAKPVQVQAPATSPAIKCVVWDLDNTVWSGVLLEGDPGEPRPGVLELMRRLDERGILLSIASKNDPSLAMQRLKELGVDELFLYPQIGWAPKSVGIKNIAEKLNIGLDTFAFIDDNPFELREVGEALPNVTCVDVKDMGQIAEHPRFQGSATGEAKRRRLMYREAMLRETEQTRFGDDYFAFLRSCEIKLAIREYAPEYAERSLELVQRTNQLNFSGRKYKRDEVQPLLDDRSLGRYVLECSDKFGSYGVVGFSFVREETDEIQIRDFMLSCRVQGKFVEQAFFAALVANATGPKKKRIWVNFQATGRNVPAQQVLASMGFREQPGRPGMSLDLDEHPISCDFIAVSFHEAAPAPRERQAPAAE